MELFGRPVIETGSEKPPEIVFESWKDFWERKARENAMTDEQRKTIKLFKFICILREKEIITYEQCEELLGICSKTDPAKVLEILIKNID